MKKICVHVVIGVDELMQELLKRTSYMAVSLSSDGAATEGWSDRWILTGDELLWARDRMQEACDRINGVVSAYLSEICVPPVQEDTFSFVLVLPDEVPVHDFVHKYIVTSLSFQQSFDIVQVYLKY